jgi:hypothetical protein
MKKIFLLGSIFLFSACASTPIGASPTPTSTVSAVSPTIASFTAEGLGSNESKKYVGLKYPPLPQEVSERNAVVIHGSDLYALSLVEATKQKMLWLSKMTHRNSAGKAQWIVTDTLLTPSLDENEMFYLNGCLLNKVFAYEIIAAGTWDHDVEVSRYVTNDKIFRAWRADLTSGLFEEISTDGAECVAEFQFR